MKVFGYLLIFFVLGCMVVKADEFVPDFNNMQVLRCDYEETIYEEDGSEVSTSQQYKIFRIDDVHNKIYVQKDPIYRVLKFDSNIIEYNSQYMSDYYISVEHSVIDRVSGTFTSNARITYDNSIFGVRTSKSTGTCQVLN